MKRTVLTKEIDGFNVVVGFGVPVIDPKETKKVTATLITNEPEFIAAKEKQDAWHAKHEAARKSFKLARTDTSYLAEYRQQLEEAAVLMDELKPLVKEVEKANRRLIIEHAVYFEPRKGETIIEDTEAEALSLEIGNLEANTALTKDGTTISDYRRCVYWSTGSGKWIKNHIYNLGVEPGADDIAISGLTEEQIVEIEEQLDVERIQALSPDIKAKEKEHMLNLASNDAVNLRSALEIKEDPDPLTASQAWFTDKVAEIEAKYV